MSIGRRHVLGGLTALPILAATTARSALRAYDPRTSAVGLVRLQASLDPHIITPWWYEVAIYAVTEGAPPSLVLRAEGCETYVMRQEVAGQFRARGATVTAFKDVVEDKWIDFFENPITKERNTVRPNIITGGSFIYPGDGSFPRPESKMLKPSAIAPAKQASAGAATTGWVRWLESGGMVGCMLERKSTGAYQPYMETSSTWTDAGSFFDPSVISLSATFSSTFLVPWLGWMEMQGLPGHLMWHSSGRKLRSLDELPEKYKIRAEHLAPGVLARDPFA